MCTCTLFPCVCKAFLLWTDIYRVFSFVYLGYTSDPLNMCRCNCMWWSMIMYLLRDVKQKRSNMKTTYTFSRISFLMNVFFFIKITGWIVFEDIYYKFRIWFIVHFFILRVSTFTKRAKKKLQKTNIKTKVHLLSGYLSIYILFFSLLMLHI